MIAERPSAEAPGPRRDEGVDKHPRPKNNAGTGVSAPESEFFYPRAAARIQTPNYPVSAIIFGNQYNQCSSVVPLLATQNPNPQPRKSGGKSCSILPRLLRAFAPLREPLFTLPIRVHPCPSVVLLPLKARPMGWSHVRVSLARAYSPQVYPCDHQPLTGIAAGNLLIQI